MRRSDATSAESAASGRTATITVATGSGSGDDDALHTLSQSQLVWRKFRRHKLALAALVVLGLFYGAGIFADFVAPASPFSRKTEFSLAAPQRIHFLDASGHWHLRPFVYGLEQRVDRATFARTYVEVTEQVYPIRLFVAGDEYRLFGLIRSRLHLFGVADPQAPFFLLGSDLQGRDLLSRVIFASRVSLSIGFVGVLLSFVLGVVLGGISGYFQGPADIVIQRIIEVLRSFPALPLWMALGAMLPVEWPVEQRFFFITMILSLMGWTGLARVVRGKFLSLASEEFVVAARLSGASSPAIIFGHMLPSFFSHIIAAATLSIPGMILGETALSFLGVGLRPPAVSWGVLLQQAQNVEAVVSTPWLLLPAPFIVVAVLAFNFLGDGLRDAADPYG